jgi:hypothetical protein
MKETIHRDYVTVKNGKLLSFVITRATHPV